MAARPDLRSTRPPSVWCAALLIGLSCMHGAAALADTVRQAKPAAEASPELRDRAVSILQSVLRSEQRWVKVHAAEYLLKLDHPRGVEEEFRRELALHGQELQYRMGIWRVLARAAGEDKQPAEWTGRIRRVFLDPAAPDRLHAMESLAKLGYRLPLAADRRTPRDAEDRPFLGEAAQPTAMGAFARWTLAHSGRVEGDAWLSELLGEADPVTRLAAAYALRNLPAISPQACQKLISAARREPADSTAKVHLACAAAVHAAPADAAALRQPVVDYARTGTNLERYHACETLARIGGTGDLPLLQPLMHHSDGDVRASAAYAVLRISQPDR